MPPVVKRGVESMDFVTSRDILEKLNVKPRTLRRWQELDLIPAPTVVPHPEGRGRLATWPSWVMGRCLEIRRLTSEQKTLQEVAELLGSPKPPKRKYRFKEVSERRERELSLFRARECIGKTLRKFARDSLEWPDSDLLSQDQLDMAMSLAEAGHQPVLFVTREFCEVGPAFIASHYLTERPDRVLIAIIPLAELILDDTQQQQMQSCPVNEIDIKSGTQSTRVSFEYVPDFGFKLLME